MWPRLTKCSMWRRDHEFPQQPPVGGGRATSHGGGALNVAAAHRAAVRLRREPVTQVRATAGNERSADIPVRELKRSVQLSCTTLKPNSGRPRCCYCVRNSLGERGSVARIGSRVCDPQQPPVGGSRATSHGGGALNVAAAHRAAVRARVMQTFGARGWGSSRSWIRRWRS